MNDQTITFAAICQVAYQVQQVSKTGHITDEDLSILLKSIIEISPENTLAVYGDDLNNIKKGLELLISHLGSDNDKSSSNKQKDPEFYSLHH